MARITTGTEAEIALNIRTAGVEVDDELREIIRVRLQRKLGKFAHHVSRVTARFRDLNGPRGGRDVQCALKAVIDGAPSIVVTEVAMAPREAFDDAAKQLERAVRKDLGKRGWSAPKAASKPARKTQVGRARDRIVPPPGGELVGRRVGQAGLNVEVAAARPEKFRGDALVDTAAPGVSATDRRAGGGSTATRNTQLNPRTAVAALEDSATGAPSRKSSRKSAQRSKRDDPQRLTVGRKVASPGFRAAKSRAKR